MVPHSIFTIPAPCHDQRALNKTWSNRIHAFPICSVYLLGGTHTSQCRTCHGWSEYLIERHRVNFHANPVCLWSLNWTCLHKEIHLQALSKWAWLTSITVYSITVCAWGQKVWSIFLFFKLYFYLTRMHSIYQKLQKSYISNKMLFWNYY